METGEVKRATDSFLGAVRLLTTVRFLAKKEEEGEERVDLFLILF
jgi:hypothetical protein